MRLLHHRLGSCVLGAAKVVIGGVAPCAMGGGPHVENPTWPMLCGGPARKGVADTTAPDLGLTLWTFNRDAFNRVVTCVGPSGVVCSRDLVYAIGSVVVSTQKQYSLYAVDRRSGVLRWSRGVASPVADSWSSPVVDERNATVMTCTGKTVAAFDAASGAPRWSTTLARNIVNASAVVTGDLGVSNRLFITQFDGFGGGGLLTCINVDPEMGIANPCAPGEVLWSAPIGGSSGNSPAYCDGVVYCSSIGALDVYGQVQAFDARAVTAPPPLWTHVVEGHNFYGGVSVHADEAGLWLYAATYDFAGGTDASALVKLDALTGAEVWSTPCNRTASAPVIVGDGRIVLSGGIWGYGTVPSIEIFSDLGVTVREEWNSALATWVDVDGDESIGVGEFLALGGWSHAPVVIGAEHRLLVGVVPTSTDPGSAYTELYELDLELLPPSAVQGGAEDRSFVVGHRMDGGSSPAAADANIYTIGASGLVALGAAPGRFDVNGDGRVDIEDLHAWFGGTGERDTDLDGDVDGADLEGLNLAVRADEVEEVRR